MKIYIKPNIQVENVNMENVVMAGSITKDEETGDVQSVSGGSDYDSGKGSYLGNTGGSIWDDED